MLGTPTALAREPVTQLPHPTTARDSRRAPEPLLELLRPPLCRRPLGPSPLSRLAGLKEGNDLFIDLFSPLDEDQVASAVENAQFGARDGFGEGDSVGDGHVAVVGAVDHQRRRGDVPHIAGGVESRTGHRPLIVGGQGRRVGEAPVHDPLELLGVADTVGV